MTKSQEALDKLASIDLQVYGEDKFGDGRLTPLYACECYPDEFKVVQELVDKEDKYHWHDLRKDLNDLPMDGIEVILCIEYEGEPDQPTYNLSCDPKHTYFIGMLYPNANDDFEFQIVGWKLQKNEKIVAWKYIEEFEDE